MIDDQRKRSRTQMVGTLPEKQSDRNGYESQDLLDQAFKHLSDAQKQIILLRDWEGYSYKEIGEILEYNESLVKVHLFRARKEMKRVLAALNNEYLSSNESK